VYWYCLNQIDLLEYDTKIATAGFRYGIDLFRNGSFLYKNWV